MNDWTDEMESVLCELVGQVVQGYARGLLAETWLMEQLRHAWHLAPCEAKPDRQALAWIAQGFYGQALCEACRAREVGMRDLAFEHLRDYLEGVLARAGRAAWGWTDDLRAEAIQQTMVEIFTALRRTGGGPEQPAAFLKWARVILFRQFSRLLRQGQRVDWLSLEAQDEPALASLADECETDPLDTILRDELREELKKAIAALKNPHYRDVLLQIFFAGLEERELAARWQVRVSDIYTWRFRALQALRKKPEIAQALRQLA